MGVLFFFDEKVPAIVKKTGESACQIEVADNHGVPELRIGPVGAAYDGTIAAFTNWEQFDEFVEAVNGLRSRLAPCKECDQREKPSENRYHPNTKRGK